MDDFATFILRVACLSAVGACESPSCLCHSLDLIDRGQNVPRHAFVTRSEGEARVGSEPRNRNIGHRHSMGRMEALIGKSNAGIL